MRPEPFQNRRALRTCVRLALVTSAALVLPARGAAHSRGIQASGCQGCHGSDLMADVNVSADPTSIQPGDMVTFTATVTRAGVRVGGIYVAEPTAGSLSTRDGEGLTLSAGALTHSSPKAASGDNVTFTFHWQAPSMPGATELRVYALAANGNGNSTGDAPAQGVFPYTWGCTPATFYFDADGDGYGANDFDSTLGCADQAPPSGYSPSADDCDDGHDQVHPGAVERCNGKDDDCNGVVDDGASPEELFPDPDGDGYFGTDPGPSVIGCLPLTGYASLPGDCSPDDGSRYPGAPESCNLFDDDCDGRVDEYVRPRCGVGWCERESPSCSVADCVPGTPRAETCNLLDDDCDGEVDNGDLCGSGQACLGGECAVLGDDATGGTSAAGSAGMAGTPGASGGMPGTGGGPFTGGTTAAGSSGGSVQTMPSAGVNATENGDPTAGGASSAAPSTSSSARCSVVDGDGSREVPSLVARLLSGAFALAIVLRRRGSAVRWKPGSARLPGAARDGRTCDPG